VAHGNALPPAVFEHWVSISTELASTSSTEINFRSRRSTM